MNYCKTRNNFYIYILQQLKQSPAQLNANVFISYGSLETELGPQIDKFINALNGKKDSSLQLTHQVLKGDHKTVFPYTALAGVEWLAQQTQALAEPEPKPK